MRNFDAYGYGTDLFRSDLPAHFFPDAAMGLQNQLA
jgi:hypothetical protein